MDTYIRARGIQSNGKLKCLLSFKMLSVNIKLLYDACLVSVPGYWDLDSAGHNNNSKMFFFYAGGQI